MREQGDRRPEWQPTLMDNIVMVVAGLAFLGLVIAVVLNNNYLGWTWLLWIGWALLVASVVLGWRARVDFQTMGAAAGRWK